MAEEKVLKYQITTEDGKVHNVSKSNIEKYGWGGYAEDYPKATVRMRDANNEDYDIPIAQVDNALTNNLRPFTTQFNKVEAESPKKPQEQAQPQQEQGQFKPTPADDARMAELMNSVGGSLYASEQSRKQLGQPFNPELDVERAKLGEQAPDNIGKRYDKAIEKMTFEPDTEGTRQQLRDAINNDLVDSRREDSKATTYNPYAGIGSIRSQKTANLEAASAFLDSADMIQKAATAEGGWTSDLARGVRDAFRDPATLTFGMSSADQYRSVYRAINKMDKGEQLSKDEQTLLDAAAYNMYVAAINNPNLPTAYTVGKGAAESLPFMVEFFVNPISGVSKKAAKELAEYTVKKYAGKAISKYLNGSLAKTAARKAGKFALGAAANVVPASAMALTTGAPRTVGGMYERMVGEVKPEVAADMRTIVYGDHEGGENVGKALAKSYAATTIENWSEFLGDQFGEVLPAVGKLFGRTKLGTKIMDSKVARMASDAYQKVNASDVAKTIKDIEQAVQFNGTFGEFAEEVAGGIANAIVVGDQELNAGERGVFNPDNLIDTYLTCAVIGALPAGARLTGYAASKLTNTKLKAADAAAGKAMGNSWPQMRDQIINASNEARADYLKQVVTSPVFSAEDKKAVLTFVGEVAKKEAAKDFRQMQKDDPAYSAYQNKRDIINNYNEVSSAIGDEQRSILDSYASYTDWQSQNSEASEEQKEDAELYFSAREDMYNYVDEMNARIRERVDARMQEVDNLANQDTGEILTVRSNYYEQPVNIVGGRLAFDDAGNVDAQASDKIIYYVDNNGKRMMATPDKFASIVSSASAADMRQQVQQEEEAGAWAEEEEEMSRPEIKTGSTVVTPDGRQGVVTEVNSDVVVVNVDGQDVGFDPSEVSVPMPQQAEMTPQPVAGQPEVQQVEQPQMQQQEPEVTTQPEVTTGVTPQPQVQPAETQTSTPETSQGTQTIAQPEAQQDQQPVGTTVQTPEQATQQPEAGTEQQTKGTVQQQEKSQPEAQAESQAETHGQTSPIPQDEKGEYLFTQVPAEQTYAYLNTQDDLTPEEARMIVDQNIQEAQKRMKKLEGKGPKPTSNLNEYRSNKAKWEAEKQQAQADFDYWNQVKAIGEQMAQQEEAPGDAEAIEVMSHTEPLNGEELAAQLLSTGVIKITRDSYLKETGFKSEEAKRMFGLFASPDKGGVSIERAGELLELASREEGYNFFPEGEANAGRNAILSVLQQARTRGDLYRFISNRREEQARREQEAAQAAYADFIERKFGMTVEEYEAYEDMRTQQVLERSLSEADKDAIIEEFILEEPVKQEEDGTTEEQQPVSGEDQSSGEVLQGEQPVYVEGTERTEAESGEAGGSVVGENGIAPAEKVKGNLTELQSIRLERGLDFVRRAFPHLKSEEPLNVDVMQSENGKVTIIRSEYSDRYVITAVAGDRPSNLDGPSNFDYVSQQYDKQGNKLGIEKFNVGISAQDMMKYVDVDKKGFMYLKESALQKIADKYGDKPSTSKTKSIGEYGSENKIVTKERYEELKKRMIKKLGQLNVGYDPELFAIGSEMAAYHLEAGAKKFIDFARIMVSDLGEAVIPYLKSFYEGARLMPQMQEFAKDMTSHDEVINTDVEQIIKESNETDVQTAANTETIASEAESNAESYTEPEANEVTSKIDDKIEEVNKQLATTSTEKADEGLKQISVEGLFRDLYSKGEAKFSENVIEENETQPNQKEEFVNKVESLLNNESLTIVKLRGIAKELGLDLIDTEIQELVEYAIIRKAKSIVQEGGDTRSIYDKIVELYNNQPTISMRSSNRVEKQQYSTPIPISFLADQFINEINPNSVLEPSAGNGMMVFAIDSQKVHVNDIDNARLENLRKQDFSEVTDQDATKPFSGTYEAIVTNPPFGRTDESITIDGFSINGLEKQMTINALNSMADNGRAAIIIGGNTEYAKNGVIKGADKAFFNYLYNAYNVADVINIDGNLYRKQGTTYPIRLILINGRNTEGVERFAPVESKAYARPVKSFDELFNRVINKQYEVLSDQIGTVDNNVPERRADKQPKDKANIKESDTRNEGVRNESNADSSRTTSGRNKSDKSVTESPAESDGGKPSDRSVNDVGLDNPPSIHPGMEETGGDVEGAGSGNVGERTGDPGSVSEQPGGVDTEPIRVNIESEKITYPRKSKAREIGSVIPSNTFNAIENVLSEFEDIDQYLVDRLGYDSKEDLYNALSAEQVDSVALAIKQMESGKGFIIGDMTGVGKGRQAAAIIRYAVKQGKKPIFMTEKANLFSDIYRDLRDIGSGDLVPFIVNDKGSASDPTITDENGNVVYKIPSKSEKSNAYADKELPEGYDYIVITYSQLNSSDKKVSPKKGFFEAMANDNILIMDESHNAGGSGNTGQFLQKVVPTTSGVTFLSGTFAKRSDNMPIYALKTNMSDANMTQEELIEAITAGGVPLQEIMSRNLVESGQMIRRERDFSGVTIDWLTIDEKVDEQKKSFNNVIEIFNELIRFQRTYIDQLIENKNEAVAERQGEVSNTKGTKDLGISNTPFASKTFNLVRQLLFSLKAEYVADRAIMYLKEGKKPVIAVANTMEGFIKDEMPLDEDVESSDFSLTLLKGLDSLFRYTEKDSKGNTVYGYIPLSSLSIEGQNAYSKIYDKIINTSSGISISPIDVIKDKIQKAGYSIGELTGREFELKFNEDGTARKVKREGRDKKKLMRGFNEGSIDVLLLNQSASTGISLHSSTRFKDQRQRVMIFAQNQLDVNTEIQMRGRTDRTGQVHRSIYEYIVSPIPAEGRLMMMFKSKLKSLDANTTSSQKSKANEIDIVDFLNKYGDQVVVEYLKDNQEIVSKLLDPLHMEDMSEEEIEKMNAQEGDASKVAGRVALLSVEEQEQFYKDVSDRYNTLINYLNDTGTNTLEITTMPLNAKTISKTVLVEGKNPGGDNAFADNSYIEEVEVDVLKKPMTSEEIKSTIQMFTEGRTEREYKDYLIERMDAYEEEQKKKIADKHNETFEKNKREQTEREFKKIDNNKKISEEEKQERKNEFVQKLEEKSKFLLEKKLGRIEYKSKSIKTIFNMTPIGKALFIPNSMTGDESKSMSYGILMGYKVGEKMNPSTMTAVFATLDGRRKIEIPLSKASIMDSIRMQLVLLGSQLKEINLDNWDSKVPNKTRRNAYIITGNILQAYSSAGYGQLISYTTESGDLKQGILMPESFKISNLSKKIPFKDKLDEIKSGEIVSDSSMEVSISKERWSSNYNLYVPLSKKTGGKYFLNKKLLSLVEGRVFVQSGKKMVARVMSDNISKVVNLLNDEFDLTASDKIKDNSGDRYRLSEGQDDRYRVVSDESELDWLNSAIDEISSRIGYEVTVVTNDQIEGDNAEKRKKAKAWFEPSTGRVVINLSNAISKEDALRSYLHEVIGHYGLRELFGEQFDDAMFDIYGLLPKNVQEEIQNYMKKNYSSQLANMSSMKDAVVLSMEEYLSRKAEENPDASWWNRICGSIRNLMRRIGIGIKFNDNDIRYILWRSKNNLKKGQNVDMNKPIPQYDQLRFRTDDGGVTINENELQGEGVMEQAEIIATTVEIDESERKNLERRIRNTRIREGWQDRMIAVKIFQEKISEVTGKSIKSWENAYDYENTIASRSQYFIDEFKEKMMKPIYASIAKFKDQNEVRDYLKAKHGLERNQKMREREVQRVREELEADLGKYIEQWNQKLESATDKEKVESEMQDAIALTQERIAEKLSKVKERESKKDYSGLTGLYNRLYATEDRVSIKQIEDKFNEFVSSYEHSNAENISKLWESIKGATNFTLDFLHDTNVLSKDMLDKLKSQYEYYIPLREWQEKRADQEFEYFSDHISDAFTDPLKKAKGRTSESGDPIASIMNMAQSSIFIGHKNMMKLNFLRLVRNNRTSLANISSLWYVKNEDGQWEEVAADLDGTETYEEAQEKIADFEEKMKAKKELGLAKRKKSSLNLGMPIKKWQARQHEVRVKELGQEYIVYINTDPRIAQAINGLNNINLSARKYAKPVNAIKTFMTTSFTTKNIAFIGSNMLRDFILSFTNSFIKEGAGYSGSFLSSIGKATKDLGAYIWGGKISPELETFLKNGGETGFVSLLSYEESMKEVQKGVDKYKKTLFAKNFFSVLGMVVERINRHVENIFRYGIFLASRESGKNVSESVKDAKEITVNFNRKGSGAYGSAYANMAYFFLNAGIQGLNNTIETASKNKARALIAYSFWAGLGYLIPTLLCGDDDDDNLYDQIPNFIRRQNICIPNGKNGYITIPLPIEIRALFSIGDMAYRYQKGTYNGSDTELAADLFGTIMEVMPKDFVSGGNYELDYQKAIFFNAMPDIVKPITDTYIVNTTWTGRPIKKETPYNKYVPEYRKVYNGTNEYLVAASKFINEISGGNYAEKGALDGPLNNPASLEYMIQQYMGGAARTYYQAILSTIRAIDPDKELATKDIPVVNRFYKPTIDDRPMTNVNERYFEYVEMSKEYESQKREYQRGLKEGENLSDGFEEFMRRNKEGISSIIDGSSTAIQQLNTVRPFLDDEGQEELDKEIYKIRKDAVDQIDKLKNK